MSASVAQPVPQANPSVSPAVNGSGKYISWEEFKKKYLSREDNYKYEWVNGMVEKTKRSTDKTQLYILRNLQDFFVHLKMQGIAFGQLISEPDLFFLANHRRPDIAWLTDEQIDRLAYNSDDVPSFIIEVISTNDQMNLVHKKMLNYQEAGVKVVWHIFPLLGIVHVYSGDQLTSMSVCKGEQLCSAAPALPGFALSARDILKKPAKP